MKRWMTVDIGASKSGVALWHGADLKNYFIIKPCGAKGSYWVGDIKVGSKFAAWHDYIKNWAELVIVERGAGHRPNVINGQAKLRGYLEAICDKVSRELHIEAPLQFQEVNVSEWKRVIKEDQNISWPRDSARQKELAQKLVLELYGKTVTEDEADAILLGRAAIRMGLNK